MFEHEEMSISRIWSCFPHFDSLTLTVKFRISFGKPIFRSISVKNIQTIII